MGVKSGVRMEAQHQEFVGIYDDALTEEFCASIIDAFEACPQVHSEGRIGSGVDVQKKESIDCCISEYKEWTGINQSLLNITARFLVRYVREYAFLACGALSPAVRLDSGEVLELSPENIERIPEEQLLNVILKLYRPGYLNLQKYKQGTGGYHHWHSEIYPQDESCESLHRVLLFMFFLNTVDEGGATKFHYQDITIKPKAGRMVIALAGFTHTHKGAIPVSSDKYIVTSWILFQRAEQIYSGGH